MIKKVLEAKKLLDSKTSMSKISVIVGMNRQAIQPLINLYDEMAAQPIKSNSSDFVCIRKQKYVKLNIKLQHRMSDMRKEFLEMKKELDRAKGKYIRAKWNFGIRKELREELHQKQLMLNVTSSNLQHAVDGYEYMKMDYWYNFALGIILGFGVALIALWVFGTYFGKVVIDY